VEAAVEDRLRSLRALVDFRAAHDAAATAGEVRRLDGFTQMAEVRRAVGALTTEEQRLLILREQDDARTQRIAVLTYVLVPALALVVLASFFRRAVRDLQRSHQLEEEPIASSRSRSISFASRARRATSCA
jgi:hypothetical protein